VRSATRSAGCPDLPTPSESGIGVVSTPWFGLPGPGRRAFGPGDPAPMACFEDRRRRAARDLPCLVEMDLAASAPIVRAAGITPSRSR